MSWLDGLVESNEAASQDQRLERTAEAPTPGFFRGSGTELFKGVGAGLTQLTLQAAQYGNDPSQAISLDIPTDEEELARRQAIGLQRQEFSESVKPDPTTVGTAGQILFGLGDVGSRFAAGLASGGPIVGAGTVGTSVGEETFSDLKSKGVDSSTALGVGAIQGLAAGVGAVLPAARIVGPLLGDAALTVGANIGLGIGTRGATGKLLEANGYAAQAAQYKAFDKTAIATDAVLGAAFFGLGRLGAKPTTDQIDAALTERAAQHADIDTAPGAPIDPKSAVAHADAIRTAIDQLSRGEPVNVPDRIHDATFLRTAEESSVVAPARDEALATARSDLEPTLRAELEQQASGSLPNVKDVKGELAIMRRSLDGLDDTFRARAKEFQDQGQGRKKAESSARQAIETERLDLTDQQTALTERLDLTDQQTALTERLDGNRTAEQARADLNTLSRGEVPEQFQDRVNERADTIIKGFDKNPLAAGVAEGNKLTLGQVARQEISRILDENERTEPTLQPKSLDIGTPKDESKQAADGSTAGKAASEPAKTASVAGKTASKAGEVVPEREIPAGKADDTSADPVNVVADEILARSDDIHLPTGAIDADGKPVTVSAHELLAQADADIVRAQEESKGFAAAAACFLQRGE
jgi:hypothetical protein